MNWSLMDKRFVPLIELAALIALTLGDAFGVVPLSRTPFLVLLAWVSLRLRRLPWSDIGINGRRDSCAQSSQESYRVLQSSS